MDSGSETDKKPSFAPEHFLQHFAEQQIPFEIRLWFQVARRCKLDTGELLLLSVLYEKE